MMQGPDRSETVVRALQLYGAIRNIERRLGAFEQYFGEILTRLERLEAALANRAGPVHAEPTEDRAAALERKAVEEKVDRLMGMCLNLKGKREERSGAKHGN